MAASLTVSHGLAVLETRRPFGWDRLLALDEVGFEHDACDGESCFLVAELFGLFAAV